MIWRSSSGVAGWDDDYTGASICRGPPGEALAMIPRCTLSDGYSISRIVKGGWHLAGHHGPVDPAGACKDMASFVEAGITTFDCADIYTGVEALIGDFRRAYPGLARLVQVHTKFVPDLS